MLVQGHSLGLDQTKLEDGAPAMLRLGPEKEKQEQAESSSLLSFSELRASDPQPMGSVPPSWFLPQLT